MQSFRLSTTLLAALLTSLTLIPTVSAADRVEAQWTDLPRLLQGHTVSTVLVDGTILRGQFLDASPTELRFQVKKSSNRAQYPKGENSLPRTQLSAFSYTERSGKWRAIGTAIGATAGGLIASVPLRVGDNEGGASGLMVGIAATAIGTGTGLGYVGGHVADTHTTTIVVAQSPCTP